MDWNNGTIFRVFASIGDNSQPTVDANVGVPSDLDIKVDIAQQELTGNVFVGVENFVIKPRVSNADQGVQDELQNYWATRTYIQMESFQLAPYIDYTSIEKTAPNSLEENQNLSRNTQVFARLPLIATPTLGNAELTTEATFASDRVLNKDSILYEMRNNPFALSNGRLKFRLLDQNGEPIRTRTRTLGTNVDINFLYSLSFTLVVYKPLETYT